LFAKPDTINDHLSFLASVMPAEAYSIVQDQITRVVSKGEAGLSLGFAVGLALALWSANAGMKSLLDALKPQLSRPAPIASSRIHQAVRLARRNRRNARAHRISSRKVPGSSFPQGRR
jgi:hypothetical protein